MSLYVPAAFAFREENTLENQIAELFEETMQVPEKSPPQKLLSSCHCIMILLGSGGLPFVSKMPLVLWLAGNITQKHGQGLTSS